MILRLTCEINMAGQFFFDDKAGFDSAVIKNCRAFEDALKATFPDELGYKLKFKGEGITAVFETFPERH